MFLGLTKLCLLFCLFEVRDKRTETKFRADLPVFKQFAAWTPLLTVGIHWNIQPFLVSQELFTTQHQCLIRHTVTGAPNQSWASINPAPPPPPAICSLSRCIISPGKFQSLDIDNAYD